MKDSPAKAAQTAPAVPAEENICAVIVTYHPDAHFAERVDRIRGQVAKTIIVDNTGGPDSEQPLRHINAPEIEIIRNPENLGVGEALNQGVHRAVQLGYQWAITFDQDSWINPDLVQTLISIYEQHPSTGLVGIIGSNFEDENTHSSALTAPTSGATFRETVTVITSGSLLSLAAFSKLGPFRSDFFIDFVDHEYCLRLRRSGYKVLVSAAPLMVHALGAASLYTLDVGIKKLSLVMTNRSPLRRYYMTRNALLVAREYFTVAPKWVSRSLASILGFALLKIPLEKPNNKWKKFCASAYGAFDALRGRTGKESSKWVNE